MANEQEIQERLDSIEPNFAVDDAKCTGCPLWKTSYAGNVRRSGVYGKGTGKSGLLVVGEALGKNEVLYGMPFVGDAGNLLSQIFREVGIVEEAAYIFNPVRCRPFGNKTPLVSEIRTCQELHADKDLPAYTPKVMLLLGAVALRAILNMQKITERRGVFYDAEYGGVPVKVMPTFHPANVLRKPELYETVKEDIRRVKEYIATGQEGIDQAASTLPPLRKEFINSEERFLEWMSYLAQMPEEYFIINDLETTGLSFYKDTIVSSTFNFQDSTNPNGLYGLGFLTQPRPGWWHADLQKPKIKKALSKVLLRTRMCFHNGDFDTKFWWKNGYYVINYFDTLDAHLLIDENSPQGLKFLVTKHFAEGAGYQQKINDAVGGGAHLADASTEMLLDYNIDDGYFTHLAQRKFKQLLIDDGRWPLYKSHAMPLKRTLTRMSYRGILMDRGRIMDLSTKYRAELKEQVKALYDAAGQEFKWTSKPQLTKVLYKDLNLDVIKRTDKGAPSTDAETLKILSQFHKVPKLVLGIRHMHKMLSTYLDGRPDDDSPKDTGKGMLQYLDDNDRVHCSFLTHGTPSGRLAARDPSLLNIPRDPEFRMCFMAPPGWKFIDLDYSQAELVLLAYLSNDANFIKAVNSDDIHQKTLDTLISRAKDLMKQLQAGGASDMRNVAKAVNFRKAYRGGSEGLAAQLGLAPAVTAQWYKEWDDAFPDIPIWFQHQEREWREKGYLEGIYGRRRHFPPAFDQKTEHYYDRLSANFPCQNGVADTTNRSLYLIDQAIERMWGWGLDKIYNIPGPVLAVHDNVIVECPDDYVEDMKELIINIMALPLPVIGATLKTDCVIVQRWGENKVEKLVDERPDISDLTQGIV
jgi:uracil-DNA glycosylase family 4